MVYVFLAEGFEIVEALAPVDILKRAGIDVYTVSITDNVIVEISNRTKVYEDTILVNFPLYCPKCKKEIRINIVKL